MSRATAFRLLLVASWLVPLILARIDLAIYMATPHATAIVPGPPVTQIRLVLDQAATWLGWVALLTGVLATAGLWRFQHWATYVFAVGVAAYVGHVGICDYFEYRLLPQVALLVHGIGLGGVAAWLALARSTLPFAARSRAA
jgi:hypothetical protein